MILSVCPNPCIDFTVELEQLNIGKLNRITNKVVTYSGKALNAAIGVRRLSGESFVTGFMAENDGASFLTSLDREGVQSSFIYNKGSTRINYKVIDNRSMLTEINDKGEEVPLEKQEELLRLVGTLSKNASVCIMSGSLPQGIEDDYFARLVEVTPKSTKKIVDTEGSKLLKAINKGVFLVKPNLFELETILKRELRSKEDMVEGAKELIDKGTETVLLSLGRDGAIYVTRDESYFCRSMSVAVNSTVGAGDCMVAAASIAIENNYPAEELLRSAVAAGTASITTPGTNLFYRDKYEEIYSKLSVEKI